jgi:sulfatase maturation enzyme AslB (radical SAM superfamily)
MLSRYLRFFERDGIVAIFHELHPDPVYSSKAEWERFVQGNHDGLQMLAADLLRRKLIVDAGEDDAEFSAAAENLERKLNQPTILYLMTAQGCNFNCGYCMVPEMAKRYGESMLSTVDAKAGIDLWARHVADANNPEAEYYVIFYGGEPLLNKPVIIESLKYLKGKREDGSLPSNLNLMIATNGVLFDDELVVLCKEHNVIVAVALDGPKEVNDALRVDNGWFGTYDRIVEVIRMLVRNGIRTCSSVSITPFNIDQIGNYSAFFEELGVEKFGFNFLKGKHLVDLVGVDGMDEYHRKAARGVIENMHRQSRTGFEYQMEKKQIAFDTGDFFPVDCTCYGNQLVIQPDGQISHCPFYKPWLGHVQSVGSDFRISEQVIVKEWRRRLPLFHEGQAKAMSGGGCAWGSSELHGNPLAEDASSLIFSEEVLREFVWMRYEQQTAKA